MVRIRLSFSILVEYDVEFSYTVSCAGLEVFMVSMYVRRDGEGMWDLQHLRCKCANDYAIDPEWVHQMGY